MDTSDKKAWLENHGRLYIHGEHQQFFTGTWISHGGTTFGTVDDDVVSRLFDNVVEALWKKSQ